MKTSAALVTAASTLLVGCCTAPKSVTWEYKVVRRPEVQVLEQEESIPASEYEKRVSQSAEEFLDSYGKDGWIYIRDEHRYYYFRRPIR